MIKENVFILESLDQRPGWHKFKSVKAVSMTKTHKHFIFTTKKGKSKKFRTDTWKIA